MSFLRGVFERGRALWRNDGAQVFRARRDFVREAGGVQLRATGVVVSLEGTPRVTCEELHVLRGKEALSEHDVAAETPSLLPLWQQLLETVGLDNAAQLADAVVCVQRARLECAVTGLCARFSEVKVVVAPDATDTPGAALSVGSLSLDFVLAPPDGGQPIEPLLSLRQIQVRFTKISFADRTCDSVEAVIGTVAATVDIRRSAEYKAAFRLPRRTPSAIVSPATELSTPAVVTFPSPQPAPFRRLTVRGTVRVAVFDSCDESLRVELSGSGSLCGENSTTTHGVVVPSLECSMPLLVDVELLNFGLHAVLGPQLRIDGILASSAYGRFAFSENGVIPATEGFSSPPTSTPTQFPAPPAPAATASPTASSVIKELILPRPFLAVDRMRVVLVLNSTAADGAAWVTPREAFSLSFERAKAALAPVTDRTPSGKESQVSTSVICVQISNWRLETLNLDEGLGQGAKLRRDRGTLSGNDRESSGDSAQSDCRSSGDLPAKAAGRAEKAVATLSSLRLTLNQVKDGNSLRISCVDAAAGALLVQVSPNICRLAAAAAAARTHITQSEPVCALQRLLAGETTDGSAAQAISPSASAMPPPLPLALPLPSLTLSLESAAVAILGVTAQVFGLAVDAVGTRARFRLKVAARSAALTDFKERIVFSMEADDCFGLSPPSLCYSCVPPPPLPTRLPWVSAAASVAAAPTPAAAQGADSGKTTCEPGRLASQVISAAGVSDSLNGKEDPAGVVNELGAGGVELRRNPLTHRAARVETDSGEMDEELVPSSCLSSSDGFAAASLEVCLSAPIFVLLRRSSLSALLSAVRAGAAEWQRALYLLLPDGELVRESDSALEPKVSATGAQLGGEKTAVQPAAGTTRLTFSTVLVAVAVISDGGDGVGSPCTASLAIEVGSSTAYASFDSATFPHVNCELSSVGLFCGDVPAPIAAGVNFWRDPAARVVVPGRIAVAVSPNEAAAAAAAGEFAAPTGARSLAPLLNPLAATPWPSLRFRAYPQVAAGLHPLPANAKLEADAPLATRLRVQFSFSNAELELSFADFYTLNRALSPVLRLTDDAADILEESFHVSLRRAPALPSDGCPSALRKTIWHGATVDLCVKASQSVKLCLLHPPLCLPFAETEINTFFAAATLRLGNGPFVQLTPDPAAMFASLLPSATALAAHGRSGGACPQLLKLEVLVTVPRGIWLTSEGSEHGASSSTPVSEPVVSGFVFSTQFEAPATSQRSRNCASLRAALAGGVAVLCTPSVVSALCQAAAAASAAAGRAAAATSAFPAQQALQLGNAQMFRDAGPNAVLSPLRSRLSIATRVGSVAVVNESGAPGELCVGLAVGRATGGGGRWTIGSPLVAADLQAFIRQDAALSSGAHERRTSESAPAASRARHFRRVHLSPCASQNLAVISGARLLPLRVSWTYFFHAAGEKAVPGRWASGGSVTAGSAGSGAGIAEGGGSAEIIAVADPSGPSYTANLAGSFRIPPLIAVVIPRRLAAHADALCGPCGKRVASNLVRYPECVRAGNSSLSVVRDPEEWDVREEEPPLVYAAHATVVSAVALVNETSLPFVARWEYFLPTEQSGKKDLAVVCAPVFLNPFTTTSLPFLFGRWFVLRLFDATAKSGEDTDLTTSGFGSMLTVPISPPFLVENSDSPVENSFVQNCCDFNLIGGGVHRDGGVLPSSLHFYAREGPRELSGAVPVSRTALFEKSALSVVGGRGGSCAADEGTLLQWQWDPRASCIRIIAAAVIANATAVARDVYAPLAQRRSCFIPPHHAFVSPYISRTADATGVGGIGVAHPSTAACLTVYSVALPSHNTVRLTPSIVVVAPRRKLVNFSRWSVRVEPARCCGAGITVVPPGRSADLTGAAAAAASVRVTAVTAAAKSLGLSQCIEIPGDTKLSETNAYRRYLVSFLPRGTSLSDTPTDAPAVNEVLGVTVVRRGGGAVTLVTETLTDLSPFALCVNCVRQHQVQVAVLNRKPADADELFQTPLASVAPFEVRQLYETVQGHAPRVFVFDFRGSRKAFNIRKLKAARSGVLGEAIVNLDVDERGTLVLTVLLATFAAERIVAPAIVSCLALPVVGAARLTASYSALTRRSLAETRTAVFHLSCDAITLMFAGSRSFNTTAENKNVRCPSYNSSVLLKCDARNLSLQVALTSRWLWNCCLYNGPDSAVTIRVASESFAATRAGGESVVQVCDAHCPAFFAMCKLPLRSAATRASAFLHGAKCPFVEAKMLVVGLAPLDVSVSYKWFVGGLLPWAEAVAKATGTSARAEAEVALQVLQAVHRSEVSHSGVFLSLENVEFNGARLTLRIVDLPFPAVLDEGLYTLPKVLRQRFRGYATEVVAAGAVFLRRAIRDQAIWHVLSALDIPGRPLGLARCVAAFAMALIPAPLNIFVGGLFTLRNIG